MVGMAISFSQPQFQTPHGGPPFQGWRKGWGFGRSTGPGGYVNDPSVPTQLRFTPAADRGFASNNFWRRKWEVGQANGFGIGDRPDYGKMAGDGNEVAPNSYGDVSKKLCNAKRNYIRQGVTLKPKYPTMEQKYREKNIATAGPGPAKYNLSIPTGKASFSYHCVASPAWSCQARPILDTDAREAMEKPAPGEYNTRVLAGKNSPILHGTLYDISVKFKLPDTEHEHCSPGPARYWVKGELDQYGLDQKIANVKVPKQRKPKAGTATSAKGAASSRSTADDGRAYQDLEVPLMEDAVDQLIATSAMGQAASEAGSPGLHGSSSAPAL